MKTAPPVAITCAPGRSHAEAASPIRAAGFPLMFTDVLPPVIRAIFEGGVANGPGAGICGGELSAVLPCVAAGWPSIFTSALKASSMRPLNGNGIGVGVEDDPTRTTWL